MSATDPRPSFPKLLTLGLLNPLSSKNHPHDNLAILLAHKCLQDDFYMKIILF